MGFLVYPNDYKVASRDEVVKAVVRQDLTAIEMAAQAAVEEMRGYIKTRGYDTVAAFGAVGDARHPLLVLFGADIALYHLYSALARQQMPEEKQKRYDRAIQWLKDVQRGDVELTGVPLITDPATGADQNNPVKWGSAPRNDNNW